MSRNLRWTEKDLQKKIKKNIDKVDRSTTAPLIVPNEFYNSIWIPFNVPSSKNSRQNFVKHKNDVIERDYNGKMKSVSLGSKLVMQYKRDTHEHWIKCKAEWLEMIKGLPKPLMIKFFFVRDSKRKADFHNLVQLPLDIMQEYGWIDDDDMDHVLPCPPDGPAKYMIHKNKPGVFIQVKTNPLNNNL